MQQEKQATFPLLGLLYLQARQVSGTEGTDGTSPWPHGGHDTTWWPVMLGPGKCVGFLGLPQPKTPPARGLKQQNCVVSQFWQGPGVRDPGVGRVGSF